jgi:RimJ/RimL family protein N-acetyltransferase
VRAQKSFARSGFTPCGELRRNSHSFLLMELTRPQWQSRRGSNEDRVS